MARPGPLNCLTDVAGLTVGVATDPAAHTGVTVIVADAPAVCGVDVRGGGPGTRETDLLAAENIVEGVDAIVLAGGSVYGLAAADGVVAGLAARGRGFAFGPGVAITAPIVPAAILFDLVNGGDKAWGLHPPYRDLGLAALAAARTPAALGRNGAAFGARAGARPGGQGAASIVTHDALTVGALACVNSYGSVTAPGGDAYWAQPLEQAGEFGGGPAPPTDFDLEDWGAAKAHGGARENTSLAVVATDAILTKGEAKRIAQMASAGFARAIRPVFAPFDGDVVFALATGRRSIEADRARHIARIGALAADCLARAVARGVHAAGRDHAAARADPRSTDP
jgi:L-aminopeptidase/D-esterase-like protein